MMTDLMRACRLAAVHYLDRKWNSGVLGKETQVSFSIIHDEGALPQRAPDGYLRFERQAAVSDLSNRWPTFTKHLRQS